MAPASLPLILVPGLMCSPLLFRHQLAAFSPARNVRVAPVTQDASLPAMAARILRSAPPRFALAGLSMGGYVAFEILRQAPDRVDRLAILDSNARADRPEQKAQRNLLIGLAEALGARAAQAALMKFLIHPDRIGERALVDEVLAMADDCGAGVFARQQRALMERPDNRPFLAHIHVPTLVLVGAQDLLTPVKVATEIHEGIAGSRLVVVPDCGHLATMERPEAVNAALAGWLELA